MKSALVHSIQIKKDLNRIINEISKQDNEYNKKIISVFQVGSTVNTVGKKPLYEDNESSDIDLIFIGNTNYLQKNRLELENYIRDLRLEKIQVWLKGESQYIDHENYFQPGHPAGNLRVLDGWDGLARKIGFLVEVTSGKTLYGKKIIENIKKDILKNPNSLYIPPEEGYELVTISTRDLLKGLSGRNINSGIESLIEKGFNKKESKEAFINYLNKHNLSKAEQNLTNSEKFAKDYIITKDNDIAKATLRAFLGVYCQATNQFISKDPHNVYKKIRDSSKILLDENEPEKDRWKKLIEKAYSIKTNKRIEDGKVYDVLWNWDWSNKSSKKNKQLVELVSDFFKECFILTSEQAFMQGYTWTKDFQERMSYHLSRRAPGVIDILSEMNKKEFKTLEKAISLYTGEMINVFNNNLETSLDEKLGPLSEYKDKILHVIENIVKTYDLPDEAKIHYKNELLQLGRMQLVLAQNGKEEYYFESKKTFDMIFMQPKENVFSILMPPRTNWNFKNEALAYSGLGECLLGLNKKKEALGNIKKSIRVNPRNSYAWTLLGRLHKQNNSNKVSLYDLISYSLKNPSELLSLRLKLNSDELNFVEKKLYSPWRKLIINNLDRDISNISLDYSYLLKKQKNHVFRINKKESDLILIMDHLLFLEKEKQNLRNLINDIRITEKELKNIGGENYSQLEKIITKHKRKTLFEYNTAMEEHSLTNLTKKLIEDKRELENKLKNNPTKPVIRKYIKISSKISFSEARKKLKDLKNRGLITKKEYDKLYSFTSTSFPSELLKLKKELNTFNI